jgi:Bacterial Ig-like domain (group 3)/FG-GAP-like repeat
MARIPSSPARTFSVVALLTATLIFLVAIAALAQRIHAPAKLSLVPTALTTEPGEVLPFRRSPAGEVNVARLLAATGVQTNSTTRVSFWEDGTYTSAGWGPTQVAVADVNGDGKLDLVLASTCGDAACHTDGSVAVLLGNGDGTFRPAVAYDSGGGFATAIAVADLNGDGKPDVVVANCSATPSATCDDSGNSTVSVLLGNGDGTFQAAAAYGSGGSHATSIAVADLNGDGKPDLLVANDCQSCANGSVGVLLGNGDGTFQPTVTYQSGGSGAISLAIGDLNRDGKVDVVVTTSSPSTGDGLAAVLLGNGDGTFQPVVTYDSGGTQAQAVVAADLNGDGKLDLVIANSGSSNVGVLLGNGDGTFLSAVTYSSGGLSPTAVAVADVNGDSELDLVVGNWGGSVNNQGAGVIGVLLGNGAGTFATAVTYLTGGNGTTSVAVADLNGDGKPDVLAANCSPDLAEDCSGNGVVGVLLNNTGAHPTRTVLSTSASPVWVGQPVTFTATVSSKFGAIPDGELVTFHRGTGALFPALGTSTTVGGVARLTTSPNAGRYDIRATYNGDANFLSSFGAVEQVIDRAPTTTTLSSSANPADRGQPLTFTAQVTTVGPVALNGFVTFWLSGRKLGTVRPSGSCSPAAPNCGVAVVTTALAEGGTITARYWNDVANAGSTSAPVDQAILGPFPTTTTLTVTPDSSTYGQTVTVTATVTSTGPNPPEGFMHFEGKIYGTFSLNNGVASASRAGIYPPGGAVFADYEPCLYDRGSRTCDPAKSTWAGSSAAAGVTVNPAPTDTTVSSSPNPSIYGQPVTITASVAAASGNGGPGVGRVVFFAGGKKLGTRPLYRASVETSQLPAGSSTITADFGGTRPYQSSSGSTTQIVNPVSTTTNITSSTNPSVQGTTVHFFVKVKTAYGHTAKTGTVTFTAGATQLGTVNLSVTGEARFSTKSLPVGTTVITATYNGATSYIGSSAMLTQTVNP